ncbi:hypothetical protein CCACVL1_30955 [Corchorus capsularis]|uniref:Uncharacterized protein n=1 Tax=Corchorus capsularis TaxID=210143 RepID=A0A1R3FUK9_COCAP|nr:hypothetical protein CCACVL1_30955 [Corchorus capsularis]
MAVAVHANRWQMQIIPKWEMAGFTNCPWPVATQ